MSTTYTDTSPVVVSPEPRRSSCSCVVVGCGCMTVLLIAIAIAVLVMWKPLKEGFQKLLSKAEQEFAAQATREAEQRLEDDPRITDKLGTPIEVTADPDQPFTIRSPTLHFLIEGPEGKATATAELGGEDGGFSSFEVTFEDGTKVDLLEEPPAQVEPEPEEGEALEEPVDGDAAQNGLPQNLPRPLLDAIERAQRDTRIQDKLGSPLRTELIRGNIEPSRSDWEFAIHGPNGTATGRAFGESDGAQWTLRRAEVTFDDGETLDLMAEESLEAP